MKTTVKKEAAEKKQSKRGPQTPEHKAKIGEGVSRARRAKRNQAANLGVTAEGMQGSLESSLAATLARIEQIPWSYSAPQPELDLAGKLADLLGKFVTKFGNKGK
jgi:hypothetical protein